MKFFCPKCQEYHDDGYMAISFENEGGLLKESLETIFMAADTLISQEQTTLLLNKILAARSNPIRMSFIEFPSKVTFGNGRQGWVFVLTTQNQARNIQEILKSLRENGDADPTLLDKAIEICEIAKGKDNIIKDILILKEEIYIEYDTHGKAVLRKAIGRQKCCGICGFPLFECAGTAVEHVVGLLGSSRVAKSSSIIAAIHNLQYDQGMCLEHLHFDIPGKNASDDERWKSIIASSLQNYKDCRRVDKTPTGLPGIEFIVTVVANRHIVTKGRKPSVTEQKTILTFVDIPGEYARKVNEDKYLKSFGRLQKACKVFWFCFDYAQLCVLQYPSYRALLDDMGYDGSNDHIFTAEKTKDYLDLLARTVLRDEHIVARKEIQEQKPVAFILTKTDVYNTTHLASVIDETPEFIFPDNSGLRQGNIENDICQFENPDVPDVFQLGVFELYTGIVEGYIKSVNRAFWDQVRVFAAKSAFFATSAYGMNPLPLPVEGIKASDLERNDPFPFQAKLPVYWTLAILGCHPVAIQRRRQRHLETVIAEQFSNNKGRKEAYHRLCSLRH